MSDLFALETMVFCSKFVSSGLIHLRPFPFVTSIIGASLLSISRAHGVSSDVIRPCLMTQFLVGLSVEWLRTVCSRFESAPTSLKLRFRSLALRSLLTGGGRLEFLGIVYSLFLV